ncbi:hypoxanthine phosphoribosyltransferase [Pedobacter sp. HMF7647]|uniref:Hypoxanthine phosphoribosyltransferase n=1 Tax=Hufsiella arboris TaxID=2695275 RepID=A0A7K1Y708_9SPHI|nr:hypoxanthine phosphoribosyltransferase [Hufsiella arboris]MXV49838.1 hypoxanthine phosphoribosyltransferase [Hufsiella arboris]
MKIQINDKEFEEMISHDQIQKRIRLIGIQMNVDYENKVPVFIGVLNGCFIFMADLMKEITVSSEVNFIRVSSYAGDSTTGVVKEVIGLQKSLKNRDVVLVEDIVDTGITMEHLLKEVYKHEPASVKICTLLLKPDALQKQFDELTYIAFEIPNDFVVGYGLDYDELGRNLRDIYRAIKAPTET